MENTSFSSRPATLLGLLGATADGKETVKKIEIPIIQRDYAQGRLNSEHIQQVRTNLLDAVYQALTGLSRPVDLDFIYGYCTPDRTFIPLDGQQRLTTLFLLHWYIARHEGKEMPEALQRFRYQTRMSSRDFIEKLLSFTPSFDYCSPGGLYPSLSEEITDQYWCERSWTKTDPSIRSMLVMLDAIDRRFGQTSGLWEKLRATEEPPVFFYLLILEEKKLSPSEDVAQQKEEQALMLRKAEDIYVKMNARGKQLSPFEHFKAFLEGVLQEINADRCAYFRHQIDTTWSDLFWQHREEVLSSAETDVKAAQKKTTHLLDNCLLRYYRFLTRMMAYRDNRVTDAHAEEFTLTKQLFAKDNPEAAAHLEGLIAGFDSWTEIEKKYPQGCTGLFNQLFSAYFTAGEKIRLYTETNLLDKALWHFEEGAQKWTYTDAVLLWGILFLVREGKDPTDPLVKRKIRQLRNMVWDSVGDEVRAEHMEEVLADAQQILKERDFPATLKILTKRQADEERVKEDFTRQHPNVYPVLCDLEDHRFLMGKIGIMDFDPVTFDERGRKFLTLFRETGNGMDGKQLGRVLLTYGDYSEEIKGNRWRFGGKNLKNWKPLFVNYDKKESTLCTYLRSLLDDIPLANLGDGKESDFFLEKENQFIADRIARNYFDWRYYFVRYPAALDSESGIYVWDAEYDIRMLEGKQLNGWHRDVYLEMLYSEIGGDESRWLLGRSELRERQLKLTSLNLAFYYDSECLYVCIPGEASASVEIQRVLCAADFEPASDKEGEWFRQIHQHPKEKEVSIDEEDRIHLAVCLYRHLLQIQATPEPADSFENDTRKE